MKKGPYFVSLKSSKQELFRFQKTWYFMLKKISSYINFFESKEDCISHLRKVQNKDFFLFRKYVLHAKENIIFHQESKEYRIFHLRKVQNKNFPIT